ncbi:MAG: bifunctional 2',3'-cyclic-nucleotide 2'-phosphodiesterase/3'-nucleotidase [Alphaproteobacteria bacterium]|nr:MAG: bifunctional 2',3'-cyclic-nucleotide 2'-phosphodiesterase/3'-nucleotidase [Alphaproteobacteria bacterium]
MRNARGAVAGDRPAGFAAAAPRCRLPARRRKPGRSAVTAPPPRIARAPRRAQVRLRILCTTDLHAHVLGHDYATGEPDPAGGLARAASLIDALRAEAPGAILLDNGDHLTGAPLGDHPGPGPHPVIAAMNLIGYDAGTPGNHDLDHGPGFLARACAAAAFPLVSANLARRAGPDPLGDALLLPPFVIIERALPDAAGRMHPVRIGVIGFLPPQTLIWNRRHLDDGWAVRDIAEAARAWVPRMREAGADLVVALCHSGIDPGPARPGMENAAGRLAAMPGIDAVVAGHQHLLFPGPDFAAGAGIDPRAGRIHGRPVVMAGCRGTHVGVIDLSLCRDSRGWRVTGARVSNRPVARRSRGRIEPLFAERRDIVAATAAAHAATLARARRRVGFTATALSTHFALVADCAALQLIADAQIRYLRRALRGTAQAGLPILAAVAPARAGGRGGPAHYTDIPPGPLTAGHIASLCPFHNTVWALEIHGAMLAEWLEMSAGLFHRIAPGACDAQLIDPARPAFGFDIIKGMEYRIDLARPPRYGPDGSLLHPGSRRIAGLGFAGRPVTPGQRFVIATSDYRAAGGGNFPGTGPAAVVHRGGESIRDLVADHVRALGRLEVRPAGNWGFVPMPGTTVLFETSPRADPATIGGLAVERAGRGAGGFARFRLRL